MHTHTSAYVSIRQHESSAISEISFTLKRQCDTRFHLLQSATVKKVIDYKTRRRVTRFLNRCLLHGINSLFLTTKRDSLLGTCSSRLEILGFPHVHDYGSLHTASILPNPPTHSSPSPSDLDTLLLQCSFFSVTASINACSQRRTTSDVIES
jgi:hypothetical protein